MWFSEGIAEYFGGHGKTAETDPATGLPIYEPGRINTTRLDSMDIARRMRRLIPFKELIAITRERWATHHKADPFFSELTHAQGWALVYFLNHYEKGKYRCEFIEYMKKELKGESGMTAFVAVFGKHGLETLEKQYFDYLASIIDAHRKGKIVDGKLAE
jgi:hypothetical protein